MNNNITEDYCSFEVSKLLKEKGFIEVDKDGEPVKWWTFFSDGMEYGTNKEGGISGTEDTVQIPTHALAIKWIRENFGIEIIVIPFEWRENKKWYCFNIWKFETEDAIGFTFKTHREGFNSILNATETALLHTLKNLIP